MRADGPTDMEQKNQFVKQIRTPVLLTALFALLLGLSRLFPIPGTDPWLETFLLAIFCLGAGVTLVRTINFILLDLHFRKRKGRRAPQILRLVVSIICFTVLFVLVYTLVFRKSLSGILATSAVLSVILGLALQDTLGNFFAGISLHTEQPFHIGDALRTGDIIGRVESITWRTTAVRTYDGSLVIFPNSRVAREPLEVFTLNTLNRRTLRFPAPYAVPPRKIIAVVQQTLRSVPHVAPEKPPVIWIKEFSDSAITYELLYWVKDYMVVPELDSVIRERIWYSFGRDGIEIPYPIRHVYFERRQAGAGADQTDHERILAAVDILKPLTSEERLELSQSLVRRVYAPGELVVRRNEAGDSMFIISRGRAEVLVPDANGQPKQVTTLDAGNVFGEMSLFTGEARTADVRALEELDLLVILKPAIERLLNENENLALAFSVTIAERQAGLAQISRAVPAEEKQMRSENILRRIQRFFGLK